MFLGEETSFNQFGHMLADLGVRIFFVWGKKGQIWAFLTKIRPFYLIKRNKSPESVLKW